MVVLPLWLLAGVGATQAQGTGAVKRQLSEASGTLTCDPYRLWPDVVSSVVCGSCQALVKTAPYGNKCDAYCASFGHECVGAAEEDNDDCTEKDTYACNEEIADTSDMLCTCKKGAPDATKAPDSPMCEPYLKWPNISWDYSCTGCTAVPNAADTGGTCDAYCASFGHKCVRATKPEYSNWPWLCDSASQQVIECNEAVNDVIVVACTCKKEKVEQEPVSLMCEPFNEWPGTVYVGCGSGSCKALVSTAQQGDDMTCDAYCASFGHECVRAAEEWLDDCEEDETYKCNEAIADTSDVLCTCQKEPTTTTKEPTTTTKEPTTTTKEPTTTTKEPTEVDATPATSTTTIIVLTTAHAICSVVGIGL